MVMGERVFTAARQAQGFRSQAHLDAFYVAYDHVKACGECGLPAPAMWLAGSASWQPAETRCAGARRLDAITQAFAAAGPDAHPGHVPGITRDDCPYCAADARIEAAIADLGQGRTRSYRLA